MEHYIDDSIEYHVLIKKDNVCENAELTCADIIRYVLRGCKVMEDVGIGRVRLFIDTAEDPLKVLDKLEDEFVGIIITVFVAPTYNRIVTDVECESLEAMNEIRKRYGYKEATRYIDLPGISELKFTTYGGWPPFMMQV